MGQKGVAWMTIRTNGKSGIHRCFFSRRSLRIIHPFDIQVNTLVMSHPRTALLSGNRFFFLTQLKRLMKHLNSEYHIILRNDDRNLHFRCTYHLDVDFILR